MPDGICADCWGSKGGRPMGWERRPTPIFDDGEIWLWGFLDFLSWWP